MPASAPPAETPETFRKSLRDTMCAITSLSEIVGEGCFGLYRVEFQR
jgi:hypothetical protein